MILRRQFKFQSGISRNFSMISTDITLFQYACLADLWIKEKNLKKNVTPLNNSWKKI